MSPQNLGAELVGASYAIRGSLSIQDGIRLIRRVIRRIKMAPYGEPIVRAWPGDGGVGGAGVTIIQSLTESFAVIETFENHQGFYLVIHSCKRFDPYQVWDYLETRGYKVIDVSGSLVRIVKRKSIVMRLIKWAIGDK